MTPAADATRPPALLFLGGSSPLGSSMDVGRLVLGQARARGFRTHLTQTAAGLDSTAAVAALADAVSAVDPEDAEECIRWARARRADGERFDIVLGMRDSVLLSAAESAAALGALSNTPRSVVNARMKDRCRIALAAAGFPQPEVCLCRDLEEAAAFLASSCGPWVVKPRDGTASIGVRKVTSAQDLLTAVAGLPDGGPFLVEQFVEGNEFSVEGVFLDGMPKVLAVTAKEKLPPPHFVEIGHVLPAELPDATREEIEDAVGDAVLALGLRVGLFHAELWVTEGGVVLGEVHPRPGGDWLHLMLSYAIPGLELFGLVFDDVLRRRPRRDLAPTRAAAARFLAPCPGQLVRVDGWDAVVGHPSVLHAELAVGIGAQLGPVRQSADRAGVVVVGAASAAEARKLAMELAASVKFVTR